MSTDLVVALAVGDQAFLVLIDARAPARAGDASTNSFFFGGMTMSSMHTDTPALVAKWKPGDA